MNNQAPSILTMFKRGNTMRASKLIKTFATLLLLLPLGQLQAADDTMDMSGSFEGWRQIGTANWRIENGEFVADSGNGHLVTAESYADVRIQAEFWISEGANSGIFMRASDPDSITDVNSYEVNIFDTRPDQTYRTGGVVHFAAPTEAINTAGQWNTYDVTFRGDHLVVILNGVQTVDLHDSTYASGPISLQYGAGTVKFRNVRIESL
jgi:hypothetical protein